MIIQELIPGQLLLMQDFVYSRRQVRATRES